ncbi:MAG: HAMP domain-containing protein [Deltaproteobacteria bacterium]|nr:HAMP domain-containing protein [Deltaproteobacteria bacterium]
MKIKSLRQRIGLLLLLPVGLLLFLIGFFGFMYMKETLLDQWRDASIAKLERAAHQIDMRLDRVINWIQMFHEASESRGGPMIEDWVLTQLRDMKGVAQVELTWNEAGNALQTMPMHGGRRAMGGSGVMGSQGARGLEVTSPRYDAAIGEDTVDLISGIKDESGNDLGRLTISLNFDYLLAGIKGLAWWQTDQACLIENSGRYIAHTEALMEGRMELGGTQDPFETALLREIQKNPYGTFLGRGHPPDRVAGYYNLQNAPWIIVLFAPGKEVLSPIVRLRAYFFVGVLCTVCVILLLIHWVVGRMVHSFAEISDASTRVARGDYGQPIPVHSADEIGQLTRSFNTMVEGLKERDFVANTFGRYVDQEIAQKLMKIPAASRLGGDKREVAILMSDIRGFTPMAEAMRPDSIIHFLNRYFSRLIQVIQKHNGIIVDFFGDSILVFFDPLEGPVEPVIRKSVTCAFDMQDAMRRFNTEMKQEGFPEVLTGIGINAGEVVVGNVGSETRAKYGIVGSAVNMTQRIQSKAEGGEVVVSESVYQRISGEMDIKTSRSFTVPLKGIKAHTRLYAVDNKAPVKEGMTDTC